MPPVLHLAQIQARVTVLQQDDIQVPASMLPVRQQLEGEIFFKAPAYMLPIHHQGGIQAPASMHPLLSNQGHIWALASIPARRRREA